MSRILDKNYIITSLYGPRGNGFHKGVDIVGEGHTTCKIKAHSSGVVEYIQTGYVNKPGLKGNDSYGNLVKIKHSNGYSTLYAHLSEVYVKKGQHVSQGEHLGYMGNTGNSYGAHLHFEVRTNGTYVSIINPTPYLDKDLPGLGGDEEVRIWQKTMNKVYGCGLAEDGSFGPESQRQANNHQIYYKKNGVIVNDYVLWLQKNLNKWGYGLALDKSFGPATRNALVDYQSKKGVDADGYLGKNTLGKMFEDGR